MKLREFPKMMIQEIEVTTVNSKKIETVPSSYARRLVFNQSERTSFMTNYDAKGYHIIERLPKWSELEGYHFFKKVWWTLPSWSVIFISYSLGAATALLEEFLRKCNQ